MQNFERSKAFLKNPEICRSCQGLWQTVIQRYSNNSYFDSTGNEQYVFGMHRFCLHMATEDYFAWFRSNFKT